MAETAHSGFGHVEQPTDGYLDRVGVAGIGRSKCVSQIVLVRDRVHDELGIHRRRNVGQNDVEFDHGRFPCVSQLRQRLTPMSIHLGLRPGIRGDSLHTPGENVLVDTDDV